MIPIQKPPPPAHVAVAYTSLYIVFAYALLLVDEELNAGGIHLIFAELKDPVREKIERYGLSDTIDRRHFYPTLEVAVEAFGREHGARTGRDGL